MSAPKKFQQDADLIRYGFLADRARQTLQKILDGEELTADEDKVMESASQFFSDIANGVQIVSKGTARQYIDAKRSVVAANLAIQLLEDLPNLGREDEELSQCFDEISRTISSQPRQQQNKQVLESARQFFQALGDHIVIKPKSKTSFA